MSICYMHTNVHKSIIIIIRKNPSVLNYSVVCCDVIITTALAHKSGCRSVDEG